MKKIILIDNYDSFTFNLYHYLSSLKVNVDVIRNDQISTKEILQKNVSELRIQNAVDNAELEQLKVALADIKASRNEEVENLRNIHASSIDDTKTHKYNYVF